MKGTNLPAIAITKKAEFVIVGPIYEFEGIIMKSAKISNELIAYAKEVYSYSGEGRSGDSNFSEYQIAWSPMVISPISRDRRPSKLLLVWRRPDGGRWFSNSSHQDRIKGQFSLLAQDFYNIAMQIDLTSHEKDNLLLWLFSQLIGELDD